MRVYVKKLGSRSYKNYTADTVEKAIREIKFKKLSLSKASKKYKIPKGTLSNKLNNKKMKDVGRPPVLSNDEEKALVNMLLKTAQWGFPLTHDDLRHVMKSHLDSMGRRVKQFKKNLPGIDWIKGFLKRNREISVRKSQNINPNRASTTREVFDAYFDNLEQCLDGVSPECIYNFHETNLADDPGSTKCFFKRGVKYPERLLSHSKSNISLMFCGSASGVLLPLYVVYKAENLWTSWTEGGPDKTRYNRTTHGWFDSATFLNWFTSVFLYHTKHQEGVKVLIGDNLASHFCEEVIRLSVQNNVRFICLPPNTTHIAQPLDVAVFAPLKKQWRAILSDYKLATGTTGLPKEVFPKLLKKLMLKFAETGDQNLKSGFRATGIYPLDRNQILKN